ncbi:MAG: PQQ-binding-like beta-propeller repeat protein [Verrucomicrobia bacterium]|nr:PQQ-binding-like beta-propeller repeat protein [Verrucomicrobiota bacterium]
MRQQPLLWMLFVLGTAGGAGATEWPQYRGPLGDGSSPDAIRTDWNENPLPVLWQQPIGPGWSSPAVAGGRLVTLTLESTPNGPMEVCVALDAATGQPLWSRPVDNAAYDNLVGYDDRLDGPRSTPSLSGDRVVVFTSRLKLLCLRATSGEVLWRRDFVAEFGSQVIAWQNAASPLIIGDLVFVNANAPGQRLMAVRLSDGTTAWRAHDDPMTHASPAFGVLAGSPNLVFVTQRGLVGLVPETGEPQWRLAFQPSGTSTAATPVLEGDRVYASAAYGAGAWAAQISRRDAGAGLAAEQLWRQRSTAYQNHWSTPVGHEGFLYSVVESGSEGATRFRSVACLDLAAGINRWITSAVGSGRVGFGSVIKAGGKIVVLTESGELVLLEPNPEAYTELARQRILRDGLCWNNPAVAGGVLFARNSPHIDRANQVAPGRLIALRIGPEGALPGLRLAAGLTAGDPPRLVLTVSGDGGTPLPPDAGVRIELLAGERPGDPPALWTGVPVAWTAANGALSAALDLTEGGRFFHVREAGTPP